MKSIWAIAVTLLLAGCATHRARVEPHAIIITPAAASVPGEPFEPVVREVGK